MEVIRKLFKDIEKAKKDARLSRTNKAEIQKAGADLQEEHGQAGEANA